MEKRKFKKIPENIALLSAILVVIGFLLLSYNYVQAKRLIAYQYMDSMFYEEEQLEEVENLPKVEEQNQENKIENVQNVQEQKIPNIAKNYQYIGYLEIPKIKFRRGFVDKDTNENNVEKNLFIANNSTYPEVDKGNFIIAAHSGNSYKSFFKNLYKLEKNDIAKVEYKEKIYTYQIEKIYEVEKTGRIAIKRDYSKTCLTLITCTKDNDDTQTVYILNLIHIE